MKNKKTAGIVILVLALSLLLAIMPAASARAARILNAFVVYPESANIGETIYLDGLFEPAEENYWGNVYLSSDDLSAFQGASIDTLKSYSKVGSGGLIPDAASLDAGHFIAEFVVPPALTDTAIPHTITSGIYHIYITKTSLTTGVETGILAKSALTIMVSEARISLAAASGPANSDLWIEGANFPGFTTVKFSFDGTAIPLKSGDSNTTSLGSFRSMINIPFTATGGNHVISATAGSGTASATFTVIADAHLEPLSLISLPPGATITISGAGYPANTPLTITIDDVSISPITGTAITGSGGGFSTIITVPLSITLGTHTISVSPDGATTTYASATFTVTSGAYLSPFSPVSGEPGTPVTISGTALSVKKALTFLFDETTVTPSAGSTVTDSGGGFTSTIIIPPAATAGDHIISITAGTITVSGIFTVVPSSTPAPSLDPLSPPSGPTETSIVISGSGYPADSALTFLFDDITVIPAFGDTATNSAGSFISIIVVPSTAATGDSIITVTAAGSTAEASFAVTGPETPTATPPETTTPVPTTTPPETTPPVTTPVETITPATPEPLTPATGAGIKSSASFDWSDVSVTATPVTYSLQIATDASFAAGAVIIEKTGLVASEYTLTEDELSLLSDKFATYHWRVKAVDNARNAGDWSAAGSFNIASSGFPVWAIVILSIFAAAILAVLISRLVRRSAYH